MEPVETRANFPKGAVWLCGFGAAAITTALGALLNLTRAPVLGQYGYALFAICPFIEGCFAALLVRKYPGATIGKAIGAANAGVLLASVAVFFIAFEGIICILMASPILVGFATLGAAVTFAIAKSVGRPRALMATYAVFAPLALYGGASAPNGWDVRCVQTSVVLRASPADIWPYCVSLDSISDPTEPLLRAGIAHPVRVESGRGPDARRECVLSTGVMPEKIVQWRPGKVLEFEVLATPDAMKETSPYRGIHPAHLRGYYESIRGRFDIRPLGNGLTQVTGTSWYRQRLGPAWYWRLWSDEVVHEIHRSVFAEIAKRLEAPARPVRARHE